MGLGLVVRSGCGGLGVVVGSAGRTCGTHSVLCWACRVRGDPGKFEKVRHAELLSIQDWLVNSRRTTARSGAERSALGSKVTVEAEVGCSVGVEPQAPREGGSGVAELGPGPPGLGQLPEPVTTAAVSGAFRSSVVAGLSPPYNLDLEIGSNRLPASARTCLPPTHGVPTCLPFFPLTAGLPERPRTRQRQPPDSSQAAKSPDSGPPVLTPFRPEPPLPAPATDHEETFVLTLRRGRPKGSPVLSDPVAIAACGSAAAVACCALFIVGRIARLALQDSRSADRSQILRSLAHVFRCLLTPWRRRM